ncbi:hypothetical protein GR173_001169 [Salmonella enterica subsp. enterica]|uniref:Uncharacterized protein n=1 Tax=Salmonella enterica subsp. enterica serovar Mapo TaxID=2564752 RepID=A0A5H7II38_SALET|nr:hypothetical protein [Salmonella enterica subsp. enterica serovar Mapo]EDU0167801.1 hypothetical protein [Salmonella enterica subsp. enterica serovar Belfast]EDX9677731.1 hypothetical protein [Salmonella enterica subsp. enterica serovar Belfast]EDY5453667.1 hypothetical protein [Salmonella enterica subsp. enterica serovar Belfast]
MKELQPHQQRVVEESEQLQEKIARLGVFIDSSGIFREMCEEDKLLLCAQLAAMNAYYTILQTRIMKF